MSCKLQEQQLRVSPDDYAMQQLQGVLVDVVQASKAVSKRKPMQQQIWQSVIGVTFWTWVNSRLVQ